MAKYPPGPKDAWLGATLAMRFRREPLAFITDVCRAYGDIAYLRMGPLRAYFVNHPRLIREVLLTKNKAFRRPRWLTRPLAKIDGNGLVLSEGDLWQRQRRLVQPAFSTKRFDRYAQVTVEQTCAMLDGWRDASSLDVAEAMTALTLRIIGKTLFGVDVSEQAEELSSAVRVISQSFVDEAANPFQLPDWLPLPAKRRQRQAIATLDRFVWNVLRQRRASGEDRGDLLSMLLLAVDDEGDGRGMSDVQARDEAITLFNAGHDSTAAGLAWIWDLIARHPHVADKLADEVDSVLQKREATWADVPQLNYTEMIVKESLRLYPPTWTMFAREVISSAELDGYTIPRGAWVYCFPWVTHRDPRFFADPLIFDPERFSPERVESIPPFAYFPFGGGPRGCIGTGFATMEMILIVATVAKRYRLRLADEQQAVEPEPLISLRPKGGLRVALEARAQPALAR